MSQDTPSSTSAGTPPRYPEEYVEKVTLRDGTQVIVRPIRSQDAPKLQEAFRHLSPETVYLRFLETFKELPDYQAQRFANVDYEERMAFVAEAEVQGGNYIIGVARYGMLGPQEPDVAETAIVVGDDYQNRGLGTILLARLIRYARDHGVKSFLATVHTSNQRIMGFIKRSGFAFDKKMGEPGVYAIYIHLDTRQGAND